MNRRADKDMRVFLSKVLVSVLSASELFHLREDLNRLRVIGERYGEHTQNCISLISNWILEVVDVLVSRAHGGPREFRKNSRPGCDNCHDSIRRLCSSVLEDHASDLLRPRLSGGILFPQLILSCDGEVPDRRLAEQSGDGRGGKSQEATAIPVKS